MMCRKKPLVGSARGVFKSIIVVLSFLQVTRPIDKFIHFLFCLSRPEKSIHFHELCGTSDGDSDWSSFSPSGSME